MRAARLLAEMFLGEMSIEVPDEWVAPFEKVVGSATKAGRLPPESKSWFKRSEPKRDRRAADRSPKAPEPAPDPSEPVKPEPRTGRTIPRDNRFRKMAAEPSPPPETGFERDDPTATDARPYAEPDLPAPPNAAQRLDLPSNLGADEPVFNWGKLGLSDPGDEFPDEPRAARSLRKAATPHPPAAPPKERGSISRIFRRKRDGRKELDRALRSHDRRVSGKQGALSRLIRGKDVGRERWNEARRRR